ncbi:hypothetical protein TKK_0002316 [Trichogramma kaykai]
MSRLEEAQARHEATLTRELAEAADFRAACSREMTAFQRELRGEVEAACARIASSTAATRPREANETNEDSCEVRFDGLPPRVDPSSAETIKKILQAIGLVRFEMHIARVREWINRNPRSTDQSSSGQIVVQLSSPFIRDEVIGASPALRDLTMVQIFGVEAEGRIRASPVLLRGVYLLHRRALDLARAKRLPRPFMRGLKIFMRPGASQRPIHIRSEEDLSLLESQTLNNQSRATPSTESPSVTNVTSESLQTRTDDSASSGSQPLLSSLATTSYIQSISNFSTVPPGLSSSLSSTLFQQNISTPVSSSLAPLPSVHRFNSRPLSKSRPLVRKNLKIGCININRFSANFNLLEQRILSGTYDIVSVVETFLESSDNISPFHIAGYNFLHCHRRGKEGGGVGLYVREELAIEKIVATESIYDYTPEYQIISIKNANNMKLLFATVYRSPEAGYPEEFFEVLYRLQPLYDNVIVTGDFNIHVNRPGDQHVGRLIKQLEQLSLHLVSTVPTNHVIYHDGSIYENCLDLVIVRDTSLIESFSRSSSPFAAAHDFIDFEYKLSHEIAPAVTKFTRDFRRVRTETFAPLVEREISIGFSRDGLSLFVVDEAAVGGRVVTRALLDLAVATLSSALLAAAYLVAPLSAPRPASRR